MLVEPISHIFCNAIKIVGLSLGNSLKQSGDLIQRAISHTFGHKDNKVQVEQVKQYTTVHWKEHCGVWSS